MSERCEPVRLKALPLACDNQDRTGSFASLKNVAVVGAQQIMTAAASSAMLGSFVSECETEDTDCVRTMLPILGSQGGCCHYPLCKIVLCR